MSLAPESLAPENRDLDIRWIDTPKALDEACEALASADTLALDTEFFRESTFFPVPALVQLCAGETAYLVDPQAVAATPALKALLSEGPLKLLHASSEDLEVLGGWAGVSIWPLVDTQVAQSLLSEDPAMGYQRLVEHWTGHILPRTKPVPTGWSARCPILSAAMRLSM